MQHAEQIVYIIINNDNDDGLLILYLMDSIMRNVGGRYVTLFCQDMVKMFCGIFRISVKPGVRKKIFDLRLSWDQLIPTSLFIPKFQLR